MTALLACYLGLKSSRPDHDRVIVTCFRRPTEGVMWATGPYPTRPRCHGHSCPQIETPQPRSHWTGLLNCRQHQRLHVRC
jgi:hypothetical protein